MTTVEERTLRRLELALIPCAAKVFYGMNYWQMAFRIADEEYRWACCENLSNEDRLVLWTDSSMKKLCNHSPGDEAASDRSYAVPNDMGDDLELQSKYFNDYVGGETRVTIDTMSQEQVNDVSDSPPAFVYSTSEDYPGHTRSDELMSLGFSVVRRRSYFSLQTWEGQGLQLRLHPADNNVAEFLALVRAVEVAYKECTSEKKRKGSKAESSRYESITIYSDSKYALSAFHFDRWTSDRQKKFNKRRELVRAKELIRDLADKGFKVQMRWVPAHSGVQGNERADWLAGQASGPLAKGVFPIYRPRLDHDQRVESSPEPESRNPRCNTLTVEGTNKKEGTDDELKEAVDTSPNRRYDGVDIDSKGDRGDPYIDQGDDPGNVFFATELAHHSQKHADICGMVITPTNYSFASGEDVGVTFKHPEIVRTGIRGRSKKRSTNSTHQATPERPDADSNDLFDQAGDSTPTPRESEHTTDASDFPFDGHLPSTATFDPSSAKILPDTSSRKRSLEESDHDDLPQATTRPRKRRRDRNRQAIQAMAA